MDPTLSEDRDTLPGWVDRGVLVFGPRKGGTTLFQNLLDGSDEILVYPNELKLKWFTRKPVRMGNIEAYYGKSRIPRVESAALSLERYHALWREALERRRMTGIADFVRYDAWAVCESCSRPPAAPRMWAAKEVGRDVRDVVGLWRSMFPEARTLFITRDPLMVTRAVLNDRRRKGRRLTLTEIAYETLEPMKVVTTQARMLDAPDIHAVAYEDLVADTPGVMAGVARFLGVPPNPVFETPTTFGEPVVVRTSSRKTTSVFRPAPSWKEGLTRREIAVVAAVRVVARLLPRYNVRYEALRARLKRRDAD